MTDEKKYISRAGLKGKRGWTDLLIKRFLPEPDLITTNPYYKSSPEMKLWLIDIIDEIEQKPEFKAMFYSASNRKKSANKAVETKKSQILSYVRNIKIIIPDIDKEQLIQKACESYNNHKSWLSYERGYDFTPASPTSDEYFLNRITLNYLRHRCTRYERELEEIFGKVGTQEAYMILKERINSAILEKYTFLNS